MFSKQIIDSDAFLDMPTSSQLLYFHLVMHADDEGFLGNPKKISRMVGAGQDDFKILIAKRFVITFESGVMVIKHWLIHNAIRMDRFNETSYQDEKKSLQIKDNKSYTELVTDGKPSGNQVAGQVKLSKVKLSEVKLTTEQGSEEINLLIKEFEVINPSSKNFYARPPQRKACKFLIETYGFERVKNVIGKTLPRTNTIQYFPTITTPMQLQDKWATLESAIKKYQSDKKLKGIADINKKNDL